MTLSIKSNSTALQVVWKASTKVGFGIAQDGQQKHVVARYTPAGNSGNYEGNVLEAGSTGTDGGSSGGSDGGSGSGSGGECTEGALQHILELFVD